MAKLESVGRMIRSWFSSILFFAVLGLILGGLISVVAMPKPYIGIMTISGALTEQAYTDEILKALRYAGDEATIKAVVLQIDSPGGSVSAIEPIYLDMLRLRQQKPVVVSVGTIGASGGYYIALSSNFIYAEPTSLIGSIGAWASLPHPEELEDYAIASGPFKATGGSLRKTTGLLEIVRQQFVTAVMSQRGDRLKLSEEEISRAEIYSGIESLRYGLIDDIGTINDATAKAARLAGLRNYGTVEIPIEQPFSLSFLFSDLEGLKSQTSLVPVYYYLYFESE